MGTHTDLPTLLAKRLGATLADIVSFCQRWHIVEFALFGSVLREDFQPTCSDIDVLVELSPDARNSLDEWMEMEEALAKLFGRKVDLVDKTAVQASRNWIRKQNILRSAQVIYGR